MPTSHFILLIELDPHRTSTLAAQLVRLGVEPIRVADLAEAAALVASHAYSFSAILLPSSLSPAQVDEALVRMRKAEAVLPAMAYGKMPDPYQRKALRQAGVLIALWDGYDERILRFQLNRLVSGKLISTTRASRRAPAEGPTRILVGGREKQGSLYSLSEGGCFIETPHLGEANSSVDLCIPLPFPLGVSTIQATGEVRWISRNPLRHGMGVQFRDTAPEQQKAIAEYVERQM